jgi:hypothetical protein
MGGLTAQVKDGKLLLELPLHDPRASTSGKTLIVASTGPAVMTTVMIQGKPVKVGVNAYIAKD